MPKPKVLLAIPSGDGWVHKATVFARDRILSDERVDLTPIIPTHRPYENNLHHIQRDFLDGGYDYWLHFDDDNPPTNNPIDLIFLNKDVIGCPTPVLHTGKPGDRPYYFNAMYEAEGGGYRPADSYPGFLFSGLLQVDAVGSGCMVIARRVLEKIKAPFLRNYGGDGCVELGGDFAFCKRAKDAGFSVYAHFDYLCEHIKEVPLLETIKAFGAWSRRAEGRVL